MKNVLIIGLGMIGGSLAGAIKKYTVRAKIYGMDINDNAKKHALKTKLIDDVITEKETIKNMDYIVISTPTLAFKNVLEDIKDYISENAIITDTCSSKQYTVNIIKDVLGEKEKRFIPGHPIAGKEKSSIMHSDTNLFIGKKWVLTPTGNESKASLNELETLMSLIGARVKIMTVEDHDKMFALTSHLPHFLAFSILNEIKNSEKYEELKDNSSSGFEDFVRIGGANPTMWTDIALSNQEELIKQIDDFVGELETITTWIKNKDKEKIYKFIENANKVYKDIRKEP